MKIKTSHRKNPLKSALNPKVKTDVRPTPDRVNTVATLMRRFACDQKNELCETAGVIEFVLDNAIRGETMCTVTLLTAEAITGNTTINLLRMFGFKCHYTDGDTEDVQNGVRLLAIEW